MPKNLVLSSFDDEKRLKLFAAVAESGWFCTYYKNNPNIKNSRDDFREYYDEFYCLDTTPHFKGSYFNLTKADFMVCRNKGEVTTSEFLVCEQTDIGKYSLNLGITKTAPDLYVTDQSQTIIYGDLINLKGVGSGKSDTANDDEYTPLFEDSRGYSNKQVAEILNYTYSETAKCNKTIDDWRKSGFKGDKDNMLIPFHATKPIKFYGSVLNDFCKKNNIIPK